MPSKATEIVSGALLLSNRFTPLALTALSSGEGTRMKRQKTSTHKTEQKRRTLANASAGSIVAHRNRMGVTFYLHEGKTKTGKQRYFVAKEIGPGALARLPAGFEVCESINGVVSVRRVRLDRGDIPERDLALVRQAVDGCQHLQNWYVDRRPHGSVLCARSAAFFGLSSTCARPASASRPAFLAGRFLGIVHGGASRGGREQGYPVPGHR